MYVLKNTPNYIKYKTFLDCQMHLQLIKHGSERGIRYAHFYNVITTLSVIHKYENML